MTSSTDLYAAVRNAILENDLTPLDRLRMSLNKDYHGAAKISSEQFLSLVLDNTKALSRNFSAEIYVPLQDRGSNPDNKETLNSHVFNLIKFMLKA